MKRLTIALWLTLVATGATAASGYPARAASNLCVGSKSGCFATIRRFALGSSERIGAPYTASGASSIDVSRPVGATPTDDHQGGGPVLTIGVELAPTEPTVSISDVTITGGSNASTPDMAVTHGGGVLIPQGAFPSQAGATVTISDSIITRNNVASEALLPPGFCGPFDCSFATGGGIFNDGTLTLINTRVTDNQVGDPASITTNASAGGMPTGARASSR